MMVCLDTHIIVWAIRKDCTNGQEEMVPRATALIHGLREEKAKIMVPACVLGEFLAAMHPSLYREVQAFMEGRFFIAPYDGKAALIAGEMMYARGSFSELVKSSGIRRNEVRTDAEIIATAIAHKADKIITQDLRHFRKLAAGRIRIEGVPELAPQQGYLNLGVSDVIRESRGGQGGTS